MKKLILLTTTIFYFTTTIMAQETNQNFEVKIKKLPAIKVLCYEFNGPYDQSFNNFGQLMGYMQKNNIAMGKHSLGIFYDDPETVAPEKLRSEIGVLVNSKVDGNGTYKYKELPGGKAVTIKYKSMDDIMPAYKAIADYLMENNIETVPYSVEYYYSNDPNIIDAEIIFFLK